MMHNGYSNYIVSDNGYSVKASLAVVMPAVEMTPAAVHNAMQITTPVSPCSTLLAPTVSPCRTSRNAGWVGVEVPIKSRAVVTSEVKPQVM